MAMVLLLNAEVNFIVAVLASFRGKMSFTHSLCCSKHSEDAFTIPPGMVAGDANVSQKPKRSTI